MDNGPYSKLQTAALTYIHVRLEFSLQLRKKKYEETATLYRYIIIYYIEYIYGNVLLGKYS